MSCFQSGAHEELVWVHRKIEQQIRADKHANTKELKLLLLGPGESGKSTVVKQMRILHGAGYSPADCAAFKPLIHQNIATAILAMFNAIRSLGIKFASQQTQQSADELESSLESVELLPQTALAAIGVLWKDSAVQTAYAQRRQYQLPDSAKYFLDDLDRIAKPGYVPTEQDILRTRVATTGVIEYTFSMKKISFRLVDVGGQRSQRRKWIHCFEDVTSIVFVIAISEYDQTLAEDPTANRMTEALTLFKHITREKAFEKASFILFLNKMDLFQEKLPRSNVSLFFPEYKGDPTNVKAVQSFFLSLFEQSRGLYPHFTCATNSDNIRHVFESVEETIFRLHAEDFNIDL
eukprot:m.825352 g.825352  ORF g.825352 m.825352 type:complete len:349 (+) comp59409_c0_seq7:280-1326(+)